MPVLAVQEVPPSPERYVPLAVVTRMGLVVIVAVVGPVLIELTTSPDGSPELIVCHPPLVGLRR